jgi:hypothetical protein
MISKEEKENQRQSLHQRKPMTDEGYNLYPYSKERYNYMYIVYTKLIPAYYTNAQSKVIRDLLAIAIETKLKYSKERSFYELDKMLIDMVKHYDNSLNTPNHKPKKGSRKKSKKRSKKHKTSRK